MRAIGPPLTPEETARFVAEARSYLGVRFRHQGRSRTGVDCVGLALVALSVLHRPAYDAGAYSREPLRQGLRAAVVRNLGEPVLARTPETPVPVSEMRVGDVALMRFLGEPTHVGIIADYPYGGFSVVHSFAQVRKVVEHRLDSEWVGYITEVFRP